MEIELKDLRRPESITRQSGEDHASYLRSRGLPSPTPLQNRVNMATYYRVARQDHGGNFGTSGLSGAFSGSGSLRDSHGTLGSSSTGNSPGRSSRQQQRPLWDDDDMDDDEDGHSFAYGHFVAPPFPSTPEGSSDRDSSPRGSSSVRGSAGWASSSSHGDGFGRGRSNTPTFVGLPPADAPQSFLFISQLADKFLVLPEPTRTNLRQMLFCPTQDVALQDCVRIQPFTSGTYFRGALMAGYVASFFHWWAILVWDEAELITNTPAPYIGMIVKYWLAATAIINLLQLPTRFHIHYISFEASRCYDMDQALLLTRQAMSSDSWILNRVFAVLHLILDIGFMVFAELRLRSGQDPSALREVIVGLASTNLLALLVRFVASLVFAISMHDPNILAEARRQGLSRIDLDVLPTFVYGREDAGDMSNLECAICLSKFDIGDMLISLPCDERHSFHARCIREWLRRQNSCPLCQRIV